MSERCTDPTPSELLKRIVRLEAEAKPLKAKIADLQEALKFQIDATNNEIVEIHSLLWPLLNKVLPGFTKDQARIDAIIRKPR